MKRSLGRTIILMILLEAVAACEKDPYANMPEDERTFMQECMKVRSEYLGAWRECQDDWLKIKYQYR